MVLKENIHPSYFQTLSTNEFSNKIENYETITSELDSNPKNSKELVIEKPDNPEFNTYLLTDLTEKPKLNFKNKLSISNEKDNKQKISRFGLNEVNTPFKQLFYSQTNISILQQMIKNKVYEYSKYKISDQDQTELSIVMRKVDVWYSNNPIEYEKFADEVIRLNKIVVSLTLPKIISEIKSYIKYLRDVKNPIYGVLPNPKFTTTLGDKKIDTVSYMM